MKTVAPEEDEAGVSWMRGVAAEWLDELADARQDIYTLQDGRPVDASR
jgi:hypothetical protein